MPLSALAGRAALVAWCAVAVLPFLSRLHYVPLPQWWGEVTVVWLVVLAWLLAPRAAAVAWPRATWWMLAMAAFWAAQPLWMPLAFPGMNWATALGFLSLALLAAVTAGLRERWGEATLLRALAWALLAGALAQSAIGFCQVTGLAEAMGGLLFYDRAHPTSNVFGHIGQRNQYAHYLCWGVAATAYLYAQRALSRRAATALLLWLALSVAWAGSRTVLLYAFALVALAGVWHARVRSDESRRLLFAFAAASAAVVALQFALPWVNEFLARLTDTPMAVESGVERLASGGGDGMGARRIDEWHKAWLVFEAAPLSGVGWSQFAAESVRLQMLPQFADAGFNSGLFSNAHNLELQLLAEMGAPGALLALGGFAWALWPYFTRPARAAQLLPLALLAVTLIHSQLEYPLWYLYFLAVAVMMTALAPAASPRSLPAGSANLVLAVALGVVSLAAVPRYWEMVGLYSPTGLAARDDARAARLAEIVRDEPLFAFHALNTLDNYLTADARELDAKRRWIAQLAAFRPYPDVLFKSARLAALAGDGAAATQDLARALESFPTYAPRFLAQLPADEPAYAGLRRQLETAVAALPERYR
ncbi:O-antigen ligase [Crenobacter luteus]|uniref:Polymerase n=1 Tax=Crenobacter luteus TaxID=1452487 RepID=A0A161RC98_9NEIS|nr:O-antigen ligase family protein [Crenobacter luteus]KZE34868.1 polymerase [Crenobacter luteus]TCP15282.1 O-antigen ligase [Crenobacter luteus]